MGVQLRRAKYISNHLKASPKAFITTYFGGEISLEDMKEILINYSSFRADTATVQCIRLDISIRIYFSELSFRKQ